MVSKETPSLFARLKFRDAGTLLGLLIIGAVFTFAAPTFLTAPNLLNVLQQSSINACVALGMTLVIISGGIDLSVGPVAALSAVLGAAMMVAGVPIPLALLGMLAVGLSCGFLNATLVAVGGLQPFIVTLGGLSLYRALALIFTGGTPIFGLPDAFRALTNGTIAGIPNPVVAVAVFAILAYILLNKSPLGEYFMAVGGNPEAARIAGVPVTLTKYAAYMISGLMASVASIVLIGRLGAAEPTMGSLWELDAIAAAAIGGASLMGGRGSILGTLIGCIILGTLRNGLTLLNVQAFYQLLATGIIIIVAMLIDKATSGKQG
jgi:ribose transport system permease protein